MREDEARERLGSLGFSEGDRETLLAHFRDAERRGKRGHGFSRVAWLETLAGLDPRATPELVEQQDGFERWRGNGALGYLTLGRICARTLAQPPRRARLVVAEDCFPSGMLGHWVRQLAEHGLVAMLTATSPARLPHPAGKAPLTGTNPLAIAVPSSQGEPIVCDVSMGRATYGDVLTGRASEQDLVPFGGEQAHKAFALALGLQLAVDALAGAGYGALLLVARPGHDPVPELRARAGGLRLPGDS
ncbi:MAG: Ldh family oxidoreductase [Gaiellaceae bacterium]